MSEVSTMERVIRSDVSMEECKKIEKVLRKNNISYFERWKLHTGGLFFLYIQGFLDFLIMIRMPNVIF